MEKIKRFEKGLYVEIIEDQITLEDVIYSLAEKDLYLEYAYEDGWTYLIDVNAGKIYYVDGYGFNRLKELLENKKAFFECVDDLEDFKEYEFFREYFLG